MSDDLTPVLIGVGQVTEKDPDIESASTPLDLNEQAIRIAAEDAGITDAALTHADTLVVVKSFREPTRNSPETIANRIGAINATQWLMPDGGNGPQYVVNRFTDAISKGEARFAIFCGAEAMATGRKIVKNTGQQPEWQEPQEKDPTFLVENELMGSKHARSHGIWAATSFYAMSENAQRHAYGRTVSDHQRQMGELFARFTEVAASNPNAWYPVARSAAEIADAAPDNRYVSWPYTKYMCAMNQINQSAALLLTSVAFAKELGVDESRFIYLHGCADTKELPIATRPNFHTCNAMRVMAEQTFAGNKTIGDVDYIDFYSCFPSAVEMARDSFGIAADDPRALTITGGLPFHGGAGNNYVMNSVATMADKLRSDPGKFGLVTANGGYFDKHAAGLYSTTPTEGEWSRVDPKVYQKEIDSLEQVTFTETPEGEASIETYTVNFDRNGAPASGTVIGRLGDFDDPRATRFFSVLPVDESLLQSMTESDMIGTRGQVTSVEGMNTFTPVG